MAYTSLTLDKIFLTYVFNLFAYIIVLGLIFTTLAIVTTRSIRSLNLLGRLGLTPFAKLTVLIGLLSLSGIPPLLGFFAKFFIFFALLCQGDYVLLSAFLIFNLFALYFYLQATRHLAQGQSHKETKLSSYRTMVPTLTLSV